MKGLMYEYGFKDLGGTQQDSLILGRNTEEMLIIKLT